MSTADAPAIVAADVRRLGDLERAAWRQGVAAAARALTSTALEAALRPYRFTIIDGQLVEEATGAPFHVIVAHEAVQIAQTAARLR